MINPSHLRLRAVQVIPPILLSAQVEQVRKLGGQE